MDPNQSPHVREVAPAALVLALIGWVGLYWLLDSTRPTIGPRWLFFFLGVLAISGTALPFVALFHRRFPSTPPVKIPTIVRQATWIAVYFSALMWLQIARFLSTSSAILIGAGILIIEWLWRLRERSQWKP